MRWRKGVDDLSEAVPDGELQMGHINLHGVLLHFGIFVEVFKRPFSGVPCVIEASYGNFPDFIFFVQLFSDDLIVNDEGDFVCHGIIAVSIFSVCNCNFVIILLLLFEQ